MAEVKIQIKAVNAFKKGINAAISGLKKLGSTARSVGSKMAGMAKSATRALLGIAKVAAVSLAGFAAWSVKTAADVAEMENKFVAVFKELSKEVEEWAVETAVATNKSSISIKTYLANVQDLTVAIGLGRKESAEMSKQIVKLGLDLASFQKEDPAAVILAMSKALLKERESLKSYGVAFDEADVKQKAFEMGLTKTTKKLSKAAIAFATVQLIMEQMPDAMGDATKTSGSLANLMKALKERFFDFRVEVGKQIIEGTGLAGIMGKINTKFIAFIKSLKETQIIQDWAITAKKALTGVKDIIDGIFAGGAKREIAIMGIVKLGKNLVKTIWDGLSRLGPLIGELIAKGFMLATVPGAKDRARKAEAKQNLFEKGINVLSDNYKAELKKEIDRLEKRDADPLNLGDEFIKAFSKLSDEVRKAEGDSTKERIAAINKFERSLDRLEKFESGKLKRDGTYGKPEPQVSKEPEVKIAIDEPKPKPMPEKVKFEPVFDAATSSMQMAMLPQAKDIAGVAGAPSTAITTPTTTLSDVVHSINGVQKSIDELKVN